MKTRLQLQGELLKSSDAPKVYKNVFDVFRKTWANEGLRGLQRGLGPAVGHVATSSGSARGMGADIVIRFSRHGLNSFRSTPTKSVSRLARASSSVD
jgi:hypothetical protein